MNILYENGMDDGEIRRGRGICALSDDPPRVSYNLFYGNVIAAILIRGEGDFSAEEANDLFPDDDIHHNLDGDPLFVDVDNLDFHLQEDSPAIDAGDPELPGDPDGTVADIGPFYFHQNPTAVEAVLPARIKLLGAVPNPFNPRTEIVFEISETGTAKVEVWDVRGRLVATLYAGTAAAGINRVAWDGRDASGADVASGIYLASVRFGDVLRTAPMLLLR
jgi:hypothetical protein